MRKFIFLIPFFLFSCKKNEQAPRITIRQQPSKIAIFTIDTGSGAQSLQYEINYFYNDSTKMFDSIIVSGKVYRFNYSQVSSTHKILLNYTDSTAAHGEFIFDANFYSLKTYNEFITPPTVNTAYNFNYDSGYRLTGLNYTDATSSNNYSQTYTYLNDSVFVHTVTPIRCLPVHRFHRQYICGHEHKVALFIVYRHIQYLRVHRLKHPESTPRNEYHQ